MRGAKFGTQLEVISKIQDKMQANWEKFTDKFPFSLDYYGKSAVKRISVPRWHYGWRWYLPLRFGQWSRIASNSPLNPPIFNFSSSKSGQSNWQLVERQRESQFTKNAPFIKNYRKSWSQKNYRKSRTQKESLRNFLPFPSNSQFIRILDLLPFPSNPRFIWILEFFRHSINGHLFRMGSCFVAAF